MGLWKEIEDRIIWDFRIGEEFKRNLDGYAFVIDVYEGLPKLVLYRLKKYSSACTPVRKQPPREMLVSAVMSQGGDFKKGGLFDTNGEVNEWIRENLIKEEIKED